MAGLIKDRILKLLGDEQAMAVARNAFALEVENNRGVFQSMMDSLHTQDIFGFHRALEEEIDRPSFDASFEMACRDNPAIAGNARREALRGSSCVIDPGVRPGTISATDLFFIPVTGPAAVIRRLMADHGSLATMERAFADAGVLSVGSTLILSSTAVRPDSVVNATPGGLREVARAFNDMRYVGQTQGGRQRLEAAVEDFETVCDGLADIGVERSVVTMLIPGSYTRDHDPSKPFVPDALAMQLANADYGGEYRDSLDGLTERLSAIMGMKVGRPHWLGRACAAAAVQQTMAILEAEAGFYGLDVSKIGFDGLGLVQRGDTMLVEATIDDISLGPVPYAAKLSELDPGHPVDAFGEMARTAIPSGHLEYGRSAYLN